MFPNTPVGMNRTRKGYPRIHGPPGDQPSYPIRKVTDARMGYIDENAISLHNSADQSYVAELVSSAMQSPPRGLPIPKWSANGVSEIPSQEQTQQKPSFGPIRKLRSGRVHKDPAQIAERPYKRKYFCGWKFHSRNLQCSHYLETTKSASQSLPQHDSVSSVIFAAPSLPPAPLADSPPTRQPNNFRSDTFIPGQNKLFQTHASNAVPDQNHNKSVDASLPSDLENLEREYQRIAGMKARESLALPQPHKMHTKLSEFTDTTLQDHEYEGESSDEYSESSRRGSPTIQKHTIFNDEDEEDDDHDYDPGHDEEVDQSDDDEEDREEYKKEMLQERKSLHPKPHLHQPFFIIRWIKAFIFFLLFIPRLLFSQLFRGHIGKAALLGLGLSSTTYVITANWNQILEAIPTTIPLGVSQPSVIISRDMSELEQRILILERELAGLSPLSLQIQEVFKSIESLVKSVNQHNEWITNANRGFSNYEVSLEEIEKKLDETNSAVQHELRSNGNSATNEMKMFNDSIEKAGHEIEALKERLKKLEEVKNVEGAVIEALDKYLPSRLVVRFDPASGNITAAPEFWKYLSAQIADLHSVNSDPDDKDEFMAQNKKFIEEYLKDYTPAKSETSAIVSKDVFKEMISNELSHLRNETMGELAALDRKLYKDLRRLLSQPSHSPQQPAAFVPQNETTAAALNVLIRSSIQRYITHTISKPDFADPASGAKVIPALTSPSYDWKDRLAFSDRLTHKVLGALGFGRMKVNRPSTAFSSDVRLGSCWPFNGAHGRIAVDMGKQVRVEDVGIVHVRMDQSPNPKSAPRRISVYAQVLDAELRDKISVLVEQRETSSELPIEYVKIMTVEYDLMNGDEFQVFPVPHYIQSLGLVTRRVAFEVESNWGHEEFTCLYRLRLFGELADTQAEETDGEPSPDDGMDLTENLEPDSNEKLGGYEQIVPL